MVSSYEKSLILFNFLILMMESRLADWPFIPEAAFLYFPESFIIIDIDEKIKEGSGENQWRKIFYGVPYDHFEI